MKTIYQSMKALFATDPSESESVKLNGTKRPDSLLIPNTLVLTIDLFGYTFAEERNAIRQ